VAERLTTRNDPGAALFAAGETAPVCVALVMSVLVDRADAERERPGVRVGAGQVEQVDAARERPALGVRAGAGQVDAAGGRPDLSVIVVTHNRVELALRTLRSAMAAVCDLEVQWLVIDSGSSDGTPDAIESALPEVRVLRERNIGFAAANNRGLQHACGRYVLLLNPDVEIDSGTFDELLATLDSRRDIGVASVVQNAPDGRLEYSVRRFPSPMLALGEALAAARWTPLGGWREEEPRPGIYASETSADWLVGAFLIARAEALAEVGPLDERFFLYSEETDWCYRFHRAGWRVSHLPVMTVTHHSSHAASPDLTAQLSYAKILFARKHYGRARALAIRTALVLRHTLRAASGIRWAGARSAAPEWTARALAERRALALVLGLSAPPFARPPGSPE
jgi:N-acetylglucosaminyl-diphospho-decaprenol L-rhamnosyltransferase